MQKLSLKKPVLFKIQNNVKPGKVPGILINALITFWQCTLSPDHGMVSLYTIGQCKFRPTCSEYTKTEVEKHGALTGLKKGFHQLRKCI